MRYDVIGDIHGHADPLRRLLTRLGYVERDGAYRHASRLVVFLGDFIDRGPEQMAVLRIVRSMCDAGAARAVMGNHEFNAVGWALGYKPFKDRHRRQHAEFLRQSGANAPADSEAIAWFRTLPLWLDFGGLRAIHACWHPDSQSALAPFLTHKAQLTDEGWRRAHDQSSPAYGLAEILLKGPEVELPDGGHFHDKDGNLRRHARLRWWDPACRTFRSAALGLEGREDQLPDSAIPADFVYVDEIPVLFGHYWLRGAPRLCGPYANCLDFSIAAGGALACYRWDGETALSPDKLMFESLQA